MIRFKCTGCSTDLQVKNDYAGKRVRCAKCNCILNVPQQSAKTIEVLCICPKCKANFNAADTDVAIDVNCTKCSAVVNLPGKGDVTGDGSTVRFACVSCKQTYCVSSKYAGRKFRCANCKQPTAIPEIIEEVEELEELEEVEENFVLDEDQFSLDEGSDAEYQPTEEFKLIEEEDDIPSVPKFERPDYVPDKVKKTKKGGGGSGASVVSGIVAPVCVAGFYLALLLGALLFSGSEPEDNSTEALSYNRITIVKMHKGKLGGPIGLYEFIDMVDQGRVPMSDCESLGFGDIVNVDSKIDYKNLDHSASGYLIRSDVELDEGGKAEVFMAISERMGKFHYLDIVVVHDYGIEIDQADLIESESETELAFESDSPADKLQGIIDDFVLAEAMPPDSLLVYFIIVGLLVFLLNIGSMWKVLEMSGESGWACLVPIYSVIVMFRVSKSFDRGFIYGLGLIFLPMIFIPALAFTENRLN